MYDAGFPSESDAFQRARGELDVRLIARDGVTVLDRLFQAGCLKARLLRGAVRGWSDLVTLNTSGGIAGGDRLTGAFDIAAGAHATIASQAAERFYRLRAGDPPAQVRMRVSVGDGATAEWLPQETILFDGSAVDRSLDVELSDSSRFVAVEMLVFGRTAMGERVRRGQVRDRIHVRRSGRLIWHDALRLDGEIDATLRRPAIANGAGAVASLVHLAPRAEELVGAVRAALEGMPAESGVSGWDGMLVARLLASGVAALRESVATALGVVRCGRKLPRVWLC